MLISWVQLFIQLTLPLILTGTDLHQGPETLGDQCHLEYKQFSCH